MKNRSNSDAKFRLGYMASLGIHPQSSVLSSLLNADIIDLPKLISFCQTDVFSEDQRVFCWELLLQSQPIFREIWEDHNSDRESQYEYLASYAEIIWPDVEMKCEVKLDTGTRAHCLTVAWIASEQIASRNLLNKLNFDGILKYLQVAQIFSSIFRDAKEYRVYFAFVNFLKKEIVHFTDPNLKHDCSILAELLKKEGSDLVEHLFRKSENSTIQLVMDFFSFIGSSVFLDSKINPAKIRLIWDKRMCFPSNMFVQVFAFLQLKKHKTLILNTKDFHSIEGDLTEMILTDVELPQLLTKTTSLCRQRLN